MDRFQLRKGVKQEHIVNTLSGREYSLQIITNLLNQKDKEIRQKDRMLLERNAIIHQQMQKITELEIIVKKHELHLVLLELLNDEDYSFSESRTIQDYKERIKELTI